MREPDIHELITRILESAIGYNYAMHIGEDEEFAKAVLDDIHASSAWETEQCYNDDDVRIAVGRVLLYRLGIWY